MPGPGSPDPSSPTRPGRGWRGRAAAGALAAAMGVAACRPAAAHVKWFCAYDVAGRPRGLENVLCPDFEKLTGLAMAVLLAGCLLERTAFGETLGRVLDRATAGFRVNAEVLFRATCGCFFVALWTMGGVLLTPELRTEAAFVPWLQLAIAAGLIWRQTLPLSALGIVVLFAMGVRAYGVFHLLDYPIFLGIAAYLGLAGFGVVGLGSARRAPSRGTPLDLLRWSVAVTMMWGSVEKWAYPEWTFPLFATHPAMTMGYGGEYFMRAAGVVEFTLAFALLWTPLVRRAAALMLAGIFISAVFEFGKVDAIGHSVVIAVLLAVAAEDARAPRQRRPPLLAPLGYGAALAGFLGLYYAAHAALFGTPVV